SMSAWYCTCKDFSRATISQPTHSAARQLAQVPRPAAQPRSTGRGSSSSLSSSSELSIASFKVRRFAQRFSAAGNPVRNPCDEQIGTHSRLAVASTSLAAVVQQRITCLAPDALGRCAQQRSKSLADVPHTEDLRSGNVDCELRDAAVGEGTDRHGVGVPLPDDVDVSHVQVDRLAGVHLATQVYEHAVTEFAGIVEPQNRGGCLLPAAEVSENPLPPQGAHRVLADRSGGVGLL